MLCACGCGRETPIAKRSRPYMGHVKGQPTKYLSGHSRTRTFPVSHTVTAMGHKTPCWIWNGYKEEGYGRAWYKGRMLRAHVISYLERIGPIPEGLVLDHLCRNTACINPEHLEPVTGTENLRRGNCAKLTKRDALEIRRRLEAGETGAAIARDYGVTKENISFIKRGVTWVLEMPEAA